MGLAWYNANIWKKYNRPAVAGRKVQAAERQGA